MSFGGDSSGRFERVRNAPHWTDIPPGPLQRSEAFPVLTRQWSSELALSADPLPPPPLPDEPAVGPEFDPSGSENSDESAVDIKPVHRFIPDSWKNFFRGSNRSSKSSMPVSNNCNSTTEGVRCSPPHSPLPLDHYGSPGGSYNSRKEREAMLSGDHFDLADGRTVHTTALTYSERVEEYHQRYAYMKSWAGLLRILGCVELLLGAAVFACVCAYVHKDNEWYNMFGYSQPQMYGGYGGGAIVCLKLWRHEATRRYREKYGQEVKLSSLLCICKMCSVMSGPRISEPHLHSVDSLPHNTHAAAPTVSNSKPVKGHIPSGYIPKPVIVPDYLSKYPAIRTDEERDQYKAVFNDQYSEYKELHTELQVALRKFQEMDSLMRSLPKNPSSQMVCYYIILFIFFIKKKQTLFLNKKQRCEYLKSKLAHIKLRIQDYDKVMAWNDGYG
uniref:OCEL domain-containing protein n=1 Tax=Electrophorus electricus TaxID=8005 RepID=A0AAY5EC72_ELEEL